MPASGRVRWGWHRLTDEWATRIVADAAIRRGDLVLDVGAGDGAITAALVAAGARVVAIELHPGRADRLRTRFAGTSVKVVRADAADLYLPRRPFRVVANPPFAVTAAIVRRLVARGSRLERADLVLPRWSARRWSQHHAPAFAMEIRRPVPHRAFVPRPPVETVVLTIHRRDTRAL